jgi:predicted CoA-binding protein
MARTVAVVGASTNRAKFGNKAVRAYKDQGWTVYPITPSAEVVEGLKAYRSIADVPGPVNRVTLYLPPAAALQVLPDIAAAKPAEFFVNPGADDPQVVAKARELGLQPIQACSILELGLSADDYGE